ncbi:nickel-dependent hydrogenase large subunit [Dongia sp.]|uniref:nickel-dependent hydrogenase large subunit n=1 Tax=Dongia sp. TaxID=1977262 RepID=UPI0035B1EC00
MSAAGSIDIVLSGKGRGVDIISGRRALPDALTHGRAPAEVSALLPRLFAVCALAQGAAAAEACENALGVPAAAALVAKRAFLVKAEAAREHLLRLLVETPKSLGVPASPEDLAALRGLAGALRRAVEERPLPQWQVEKRAIRAHVTDLVTRHLYVPAAADEPARFLNWLEGNDRPLARFCQHLLDHDAATLGAEGKPSRNVADLAVDEIGARLLGPDGDSFSTRPGVDGGQPETTSFIRLQDAPLVAGLKARFGDGLLTRIVARQLEVVTLVTDMARLDPACDLGSAPFRLADAPSGTGEGFAAVETARGRLIHAVRLRDGNIADYRILAPTDWNFHPEGPVMRRLDRLSNGAPATESRARMLIDAFDPCAPYRLMVQ